MNQASRTWLALCALHGVASMLMWWAGDRAVDALTWRADGWLQQPWTLWTSPWVHMNTPHLIGNQVALGALAAFAWTIRPTLACALAWLLAWPLAVLYPTPVPFGLGQAWQRLEAALVALTEGSALQGWLPQATPSLPLSPLAEALVVALCLWAPVLLAYAVLRRPGQRLVFALLFAGVVLAAGALSASLTCGPAHAWAWLTPQAQLGLVLALVVGVLCVVMPRRLCNVVMLLCLAVSLSLLNDAPLSPYFAQSLEVWEQGRFIRFHGLSQWLGWLWPFAALVFGLLSVSRPSTARTGAA